MIPFRDYFSAQAAAYAEFRPRYPDALFAWLASVAPGRGLAWDCATGSGQAAAGLIRYFAHVVATDASATQLEHAAAPAGVSFLLSPAEASGLASRSVDLVTVAQALHWFRRDAFFAEAARVLRPRGVIAVWCYDVVRISPAIDAVVDAFYHETLRADWPPERRVADDRYRTVAFPFAEFQSPELVMMHEWTRAQLLGYLRTWSAVRAFVAREGRDPVLDVEQEIAPLWPRAAERRVACWPLYVRAGRAERDVPPEPVTAPTPR